MYILKRSGIGGYNPAFGKVIRNSEELKSAIREHNDRTGEDLVEVGNFDVSSHSTKRHRNRFEWGEKDRKEAYDLLDKIGVKD